MSVRRHKYIFVVGGVLSGVGKGITTASIGLLLESRGYSVTPIKIDPYINVDAGTMNPTEHGEVFVLDDGDECDQDMGNYERFLNKNLTRVHYMTTGRVYQAVIEKERALKFHGKCVEVVPHIPLEVIERINAAMVRDNSEIAVIEIGGTIGEYQNLLFLEAARILKTSRPKDVAVVMVSYLPTPNNIGEMKTKPTQYAVRTLMGAGLLPDMLLARSGTGIDKKRREKLAFFCNVADENIINAPDVSSIYNVPINLEKDGISRNLLNKLGLPPRRRNLIEYQNFLKNIARTHKTIQIAVVGKYFATGDQILSDVYLSVIEALKHAGTSIRVKPILTWVQSDDLEGSPQKIDMLKQFDGIIVPGGFGSRGVEGIINAIKFARENKMPFLGLCYGLQLAVVEYSRNMANLKDANTTEIDGNTPHPVICILPEQVKNVRENRYGGSMRLGSYPTQITKGTLSYTLYGRESIEERHRHRYEVNPEYIETLKDHGLVFSGTSPSKKLMEIIELPQAKHPFFMGVQFHPEFKSRPLKPHPLFLGFVQAALNQSQKRKRKQNSPRNRSAGAAL